MNNRRFLVFSALIVMLSMAGIFLPANAKASPLLKAATPTPRPALKTAVFDLTSVNKVPPVDIINQISFSGRGGGELCKAINYSNPTISETSDINQDLMESAYMAVCGWAKNERLTGSVVYPNGQSQSVRVRSDTSNGNHVGIISFTPRITHPTGKYVLVISGKTSSVQFIVNFRIPGSPHIYILDKNHLLLYGFSPSESLRLFYYASQNGTLKGWQEYTAGADGRLEIKTSLNVETDGVFIAIGKKTGEVRLLGMSALREATIVQNGKVVCPNGILSRVKVGDRIRAAYTDGTRLRIRDQIGFENVDRYKVEEGTKMTITGGPKCTDDGVTWWKVEVSADVKGWVAEYWHGDEYLIEPLP